MNIGIEYWDLDSNEIPKELFLPKYRIDNSIFIDEKDKSNSNNVLTNVNRINLFIGANNSGKSRFLRGLIKLEYTNLSLIENIEISLTKHVEKIKSLYEKVYTDIDDIILNPKEDSLKKLEHFFTNLGGLKDTFSYVSNYNAKSDNITLLKKLQDKLIKNETTFNVKPDKKELILELLKKIFEFDSNIKLSKTNININKTYIPVLRYLNSNSDLKKETFIQTLEKQYRIKSNIFTGLDVHNKIAELVSKPYHIQKAKEEFEFFLSENFFENSKIRITASSDYELRLLINNEERELYNLGDGVQALILILFPIFMAKEKEWLFIEEPETHLHPGYQRIFLDTILNNEFIKAKNLRFFFTTHSNHFLDQSLMNDDISIFQFKKENEDLIDIKTNIKPSKETLDLLGVTSSSVLIANSSIWIEGPTDRKYVSKWLSVFPEFSLKEDIDYAFFEYGGNLIAHYLFDENFEDPKDVREQINSFALSNHIYLLADNDNPEEGSAKENRRFELEKLSEEIENFFYQNTEVKEIENLLPVNILKGFLPELLKKEHPGVIENIEFKRNDYKDVGLGDFFEKLLMENEIPEKDLKKFRADSGTLKSIYKLKLCNFVIQGDYSYDNFIEDNEILKGIIKDLYNFIKPNN